MRHIAISNRKELAANPYPGRGIVVGLDETGKNLVQVYWIMGRSENSRNRVFSREGGRIFTEAADPSKVKDSSLIIYNAMCEIPDEDVGVYYVISNGNQTDKVVNGFLEKEKSFYATMSCCTYEPDEPNFTPRITAFSYWCDGRASTAMSILRKSSWGKECDRHLYQFNRLGLGLGYCLTTYSGDGNPLPAFQGEPYLLPLCGEIHAVADTLWEALNPDNRVSLAVKFIPKGDENSHKVVIINKYSKKVG